MNNNKGLGELLATKKTRRERETERRRERDEKNAPFKRHTRVQLKKATRPAKQHDKKEFVRANTFKGLTPCQRKRVERRLEISRERNQTVTETLSKVA